MNVYDADWGISKIEQGPFELPDKFWKEVYYEADKINSPHGMILCPHSFKKRGYVDYDSYNGIDKFIFISLRPQDIVSLVAFNHTLKA